MLFKSCVAFRSYIPLHDLADQEDCSFIVKHGTSYPAGRMMQKIPETYIILQWQEYELKWWGDVDD